MHLYLPFEDVALYILYPVAPFALFHEIFTLLVPDLATDVKIGDKNTLHSQEEVEVSNPNAPFANADMETVWDNICQEAAQKMPALRTLRKCTIVHSMTPGEIVIQVTNDTIKGFVEEKKQMLVEISRELTGTAKHISILDSKQGKREDKSIEEVAERVEDILGISVEIK